VDVLECAKCHGRFRMLGEVPEPALVSLVLGSLALPTEAPRAARARDPTELLGEPLGDYGSWARDPNCTTFLPTTDSRIVITTATVAQSTIGVVTAESDGPLGYPGRRSFSAIRVGFASETTFSQPQHAPGKKARLRAW
jgi:hypothetical protein